MTRNSENQVPDALKQIEEWRPVADADFGTVDVVVLSELHHGLRRKCGEVVRYHGTRNKMSGLVRVTGELHAVSGSKELERSRHCTVCRENYDWAGPARHRVNCSRGRLSLPCGGIL